MNTTARMLLRAGLPPVLTGSSSWAAARTTTFTANVDAHDPYGNEPWALTPTMGWLNSCVTP